LFLAVRGTDRQTDTTKLTVAFSNFAKAPKIVFSLPLNVVKIRGMSHIERFNFL
jgi:hypothetical protein